MTARKTRHDTLAVSLLLGCCLFWGLQQVLIKATISELPPMFQASLRLLGATALLWLWCLWRGIALFGRDGSLRAGLLAGALRLKESVTPGLLAALALVAVGVVLVNRQPAAA